MARFEFWQYGCCGMVALIFLHLYVSPYTKVEESFNIQATHDILKYGVPMTDALDRLKAQYDHMTFPGAVPRTFVGPLVLAAAAKLFVWCGDLHGEQQQLAVRGILGFLNGYALCLYTSGVRQAYGNTTAGWYTLLQASQFHIMYYASRTLPNMFAFGISTLALRYFLPAPNMARQSKNVKLGIYLLTLATVIFRSELALLLGSHCLYMFFKSRSLASAWSMTRYVILPAAVTGAIVGLLLTVSIDTYFWQSPTPIWPELAAFLSNVFPSKDGLGASAWGTSPWHWYLTSALPRLLLNPVVLVLIAWGLTSTTLRPAISDLLVPSLGYTLLYSILPHKETRFLFPILPPITTALALCANSLSIGSDRSSWKRRFHALLLSSTILTTLVSTVILLPLSAQTYPGAHALQSLHTLSLNYGPQPRLRVHLTNLALQTGVTHFLDEPTSELHARPVFTLPGSADGLKPTISSKPTQWVYDKSDNQTDFLSPAFWSRFDYVVVEDPGRVIGAWDVVDRVPGLGSRPRVLPPDVGRGLLVSGPKQRRREDDGLSRLAGAMYGDVGRWLYGFLHDVLREGYGVDRVLGQQWSWTRGWWLHWGLETKLYVLKRAEGGRGL